MCIECQFLVENSLNYKDNYVHNLFCNPHFLENHDSITSCYIIENQHLTYINTQLWQQTLQLNRLPSWGTLR